jgi:hypothetical protein
MIAALAAIGMFSGALPAASDEATVPGTATPDEQFDDFAFPGRDYEPSLWSADAALDANGTGETVEELDDFAFPGRDYMPLIWPPTPVTEDSSFPGKEERTGS